MTENTPPAAVSAVLPPPALEAPALGSLVEFNSTTAGIERIRQRHANHKLQFDIGVQRRSEIFWLFPVASTMLVMILAGHFGVMEMMKPSGSNSERLAIAFTFVSILLAMRGGIRLCTCGWINYAENSSAESADQTFNKTLAEVKGRSDEAGSTSLEKVLTGLDLRYQVDAEKNARANVLAWSRLKKSMNDLVVSGVLLLLTAMACVVGPLIEKSSNTTYGSESDHSNPAFTRIAQS